MSQGIPIGNRLSLKSHIKQFCQYYCLALLLILTSVIYWPGLYGGFIFDDYPNIVFNQNLELESLSPGELK